jgi:hypothetical protein
VRSNCSARVGGLVYIVGGDAGPHESAGEPERK